MDSDGNNLRQLTTFGGSQPSWSYDGNNEIYVIDLTTEVETRITNNTYEDNNPSWSPDGTQIVFNGSRPDGMWVIVMNADGTNEQKIRKIETGGYVDSGEPAWSSP